jgi:hypothetical protein
MNESVGCLLFDDRALVVEGIDLRDANESIHSGKGIVRAFGLTCRNATHKTEKKSAAPLL